MPIDQPSYERDGFTKITVRNWEELIECASDSQTSDIEFQGVLKAFDIDPEKPLFEVRQLLRSHKSLRLEDIGTVLAAVYKTPEKPEEANRFLLQMVDVYDPAVIQWLEETKLRLSANEFRFCQRLRHQIERLLPEEIVFRSKKPMDSADFIYSPIVNFLTMARSKISSVRSMRSSVTATSQVQRIIDDYSDFKDGNNEPLRDLLRDVNAKIALRRKKR